MPVMYKTIKQILKYWESSSFATFEQPFVTCGEWVGQRCSITMFYAADTNLIGLFIWKMSGNVRHSFEEQIQNF